MIMGFKPIAFLVYLSFLVKKFSAYERRVNDCIVICACGDNDCGDESDR